jgi:hypothetical protein
MLMAKTTEKLRKILEEKVKNQIGEQILNWLDEPTTEVYEVQRDEYYVSVHVAYNVEIGFLISDGAY